MSDDYYKTLGVAKSASKDDIKKAYKKLAMKYHPDKNKGDKSAEERFKKINEAYAVLSDDEKRRQYDQFGAEGFSNRFSQEDIFRGFDIGSLFEEFGLGGDIFSSFFGGGRKPGKKAPFSFNFGGQPSGGANPFSSQAQSKPKPKHTEISLELTLEEAVYGGKKTISLNAGDSLDKIILAIPQGIEEGKKLKVKGKGVEDRLTGSRGDLFCKISIKPHPSFKREGNDLIVEKEIKLTDLVLGGSVSVQTLDGKTLDLKIPALTKNNSLMRIKGKGVPKGSKEAGNLMVKLIAALPTKLSADQKALFEELAKSDI